MRLECLDLVVSYPAAAARAVDGIDAAVGEGELVGVVGPSGSGKSTLLLALAALMRPDSGSVRVDGADVWAGDVVATRRCLGVVFQMPETQLFGETVAEELAFGPRQMGVPAAELDDRVAGALVAVGLGPEMAERSPFALSGGEQRRVAVAAALAMKPDILLLDEPTAGLDLPGREALLALVRGLVDGGMGALVVSHDAGPLVAVADRCVVLDRGHVAWSGPAFELASDPEKARSLGIEPTVEQLVAAGCVRQGLALPVGVRWTPESLAAAIAEARR